jgi:hypothetical protein
MAACTFAFIGCRELWRSILLFEPTMGLWRVTEDARAPRMVGAIGARSKAVPVHGCTRASAVGVTFGDAETTRRRPWLADLPMHESNAHD